MAKILKAGNTEKIKIALIKRKIHKVCCYILKGKFSISDLLPICVISFFLWFVYFKYTNNKGKFTTNQLQNDFSYNLDWLQNINKQDEIWEILPSWFSWNKSNLIIAIGQFGKWPEQKICEYVLRRTLLFPQSRLNCGNFLNGKLIWSIPHKTVSHIFNILLCLFETSNAKQTRFIPSNFSFGIFDYELKIKFAISKRSWRLKSWVML